VPRSASFLKDYFKTLDRGVVTPSLWLIGDMSLSKQSAPSAVIIRPEVCFPAIDEVAPCFGVPYASFILPSSFSASIY